MWAEIDAFRHGFPDFLIATGTAAVLLVVATSIYILLTPWKELALVKNQNGAAGLALAGAITASRFRLPRVLQLRPRLWGWSFGALSRCFCSSSPTG